MDHQDSGFFSNVANLPAFRHPFFISIQHNEILKEHSLLMYHSSSQPSLRSHQQRPHVFIGADKRLAVCRPCLLKLPAVLKIALLKMIQVCCCRCAFCIKLCIILHDLGVLKIALLKTILGVWWYAIALACFKRQGLGLKPESFPRFGETFRFSI